MFEVLVSFVSSFRVYFRTQSDNQLEILALRHQIGVLQRKTPKPKLKPADRRLWVWLSQCWPRWRSALVMVKPATVIDWHRRGFRWYWKLLKLGIQIFGSFRRHIHGPASEATVTDLADLLEESRGTIGLRRFFHGTDGVVSGMVRLHRDAT